MFVFTKRCQPMKCEILSHNREQTLYLEFVLAKGKINVENQISLKFSPRWYIFPYAYRHRISQGAESNFRQIPE